MKTNVTLSLMFQEGQNGKTTHKYLFQRCSKSTCSLISHPKPKGKSNGFQYLFSLINQSRYPNYQRGVRSLGSLFYNDRANNY